MQQLAMESRLPRSKAGPRNRMRKEVEVFVAARPFQAFGGPLIQRMSDEMKAMLVDAGICHYMCIFREPTGRMLMFDFGPVGGEVHVDLRPCLTENQANAMDAKNGHRHRRRRRKKAVQGEVRVTEVCRYPRPCVQLDALPSASMHVGTTSLSLKDIERLNIGRSLMYELNINDCRHYVNDIIRETTGVSNVAARLVHHQFLHRRQHSLKPFDHVFPALQCITNIDNWLTVQRSANAAAAMLLLTCGHPLLLSPVASCTAGVQAAAALAMRASATAAAHKRLIVSSAAAAVSATGNKLLDPEGMGAAPNRLVRVGLASRRVAEKLGGAASDAVAALGRAVMLLQHPEDGGFARCCPRLAGAGGLRVAAVACAAVKSSAPKCAEASAAGAKHVGGLLSSLGAAVHMPFVACSQKLHMPLWSANKASIARC